MSKDAVRIPDEAVVAAITTAVVQRYPEGTPNIEAAVRSSAPIIVAAMIDDLIFALEGHRSIYDAMGDPAVRGVQRAIEHLAAYKICVEDTEGEPV